MKSHERKPPREGWAKTPRLIWALGIGKTSKAVLAVLVSYADEDGLCWPSQETIRRDVTGSRRGVQRALDVLEGKPLKRGDKVLLETPAIARLPALGPGGVRRIVVAGWVLSDNAKLGSGVRQRDASTAVGAPPGRRGRVPGALGVRPRGAQNENQERELGNEGIAGADSSKTTTLPGDVQDVIDRLAANHFGPVSTRR